MRRLLLPLMAASFVAGAAQAQSQPEPGPTEVEGVTIEANSLREAVASFVAEVGAAPRGQNLARWDGRVCVGVMNMTPRYAQLLADHVSAVGLAVGLDVGEPGCQPNVLILADSNGDALASRMAADHPLAFRPDIDNSNRGRAALSRFRTSGAPVRWWHVTQTVSSDTGESAEGGATVRVRGASRLRGNVREDMHHVIIILDTSRIGSVTFASLADYVAMIALAQVDDQAETASYDSILNLFAGGVSRNGLRMTQWDLDYLRGLYSAPPDALRPSRQEREIAGEILNSAEREATSPPSSEP